MRTRYASACWAMLAWLLALDSQAQDAPATVQPPTAAATESPPEPAPEQPAATPAEGDEFAQLKARVAALEEKQHADAVAALMGADADEGATPEREVLRIYGFVDVGYSHLIIPSSSFLYNVTPTRAGSFVLGNLDLYFDAQPSDTIRALAEVRFTNYPHGEEQSFGGFGGTYKRVDNTAHDFGSASGNMTNRWGGIIIENAWGQWRAQDWLKVRVGAFLAPVGVWYVDHGSPTLISLSLPFFVSNEIVPLHQTGIQLLGDFSSGPVDLAYRLYVTNGRAPALLDFTNDKAVGARVTATISGNYTLMFGTSFYWGTVTDIQKNIAAVSPSLKINWDTTLEYTETVAGADVSLDIGNLRLRSEGYFRRVTYEPGKHPALSAPGQYRANSHEYDAYLLGAYTLPAGFEVFVYGEYWHYIQSVGSDLAILGAGLTYRLTPAAQVKAQFNRSLFYDFKSGDDFSKNNFTSIYARFIVAF
ncbi:MAG TPA: hypothetical protein VFN67_32200 [Polyangiales bacterium]|nr:hypothetical protein [Polyangiales bacterium]